MKYASVTSLLIGAALLVATVPTPASAALSEDQIDSVLNLLESFGIGGSTASTVEAALRGTSVAGSKIKVATQGIFTVRGTTPSGTYKVGETIPLGTFAIFAPYTDLDGSTFRAGSTFSTSESLSPVRSVGLMYDCPEVIKRGTVGTCIAKVRFVEPGTYYYELADLSIEKTKATDYAPEAEVLFVGEGALTIPLFK